MDCNRYLQGCLKGLTVFSVILLAGCARPVAGLYPPEGSDVRTVYVVNNYGWHTSIVVPGKDAAPYIRASDDFKDARYLEIGWGDEVYYQARKTTSAMGMKAIFWPTDSVLHVVALDAAPVLSSPDTEVVALSLSEKGFEKLAAFIDDSFAKDAKGEIIRLGSGLYGTSRFYRAKGTFYLFNDCNRWSADAIRAAGFPIITFSVITSAHVMQQLKLEER